MQGIKAQSGQGHLRKLGILIMLYICALKTLLWIYFIWPSSQLCEVDGAGVNKIKKPQVQDLMWPVQGYTASQDVGKTPVQVFQLKPELYKGLSDKWE